MHFALPGAALCPYIVSLFLQHLPSMNTLDVNGTASVSKAFIVGELEHWWREFQERF